MAKDPDILVDLTTAHTAFEAEMIAESLRAQGIPAEAFTIVGSMLQWDIAVTQPMRIQVRRRDLARAAEILRAIRAESVDMDWSEVDTSGPPEGSEADAASEEPPEEPPVPPPNAAPPFLRAAARPAVIFGGCLIVLEPLFFGVLWLLGMWGWDGAWSLLYTVRGHMLVIAAAAVITGIVTPSRKDEPGLPNKGP